MAEPTPVRTGVTRLIIPPRATNAPTGSAFMEQLRTLMGEVHGLSGQELERRRAQAEEMIFQEVRRGNMPDFMRPENYRQITVQRTIGGKTVEVTIRVCPDYLAIGRNDDYVLVPINPRTAQRIADQFGLALPTQSVVDMLDDEAKRTGGYLGFFGAPTLARGVINPRTERPAIEGEAGARWNNQKYGFYEGRWMLSPEFTLEQNRLIREARTAAGDPAGIRSGHKKDVVYDIRAIPDPAKGPRVVIYHRGIQGLSDIHEVTYHDYSHGIRFLDGNVRVTITQADGSQRTEEMDMATLLNSQAAFRQRTGPDAAVYQGLYRLLSPAPMDITQMYRPPQTVPRRTPQPEPERHRQAH